MHKARAKEKEQRERGDRAAEPDVEDPWEDWAQMRSETWNRWARGTFDKPGDADAFRRAYRQAFETFGDLPLERIGREVFAQFETIYARR